MFLSEHSLDTSSFDEDRALWGTLPGEFNHTNDQGGAITIARFIGITSPRNLPQLPPSSPNISMQDEERHAAHSAFDHFQVKREKALIKTEFEGADAAATQTNQEVYSSHATGSDGNCEDATTSDSCGRSTTGSPSTSPTAKKKNRRNRKNRGKRSGGASLDESASNESLPEVERESRSAAPMWG